MLSRSEKRRLIDLLCCPDDLSLYHENSHVFDDTFARAVLSNGVEPGDMDISTLVDAVGAHRILMALFGDNFSQLIEGNNDDSSADLHYEGERLRLAFSRWKKRFDPHRAIDSLHHAARVRAALITPHSAHWPTMLNDLGPGSPLALWVRGDSSILPLLRRSIGLVGARAASGYGTHVAMEAAAGLGDRGFIVVSGGALGIDGSAHRAALARDHRTVAFLAGGIDRLYPRANSELLQRVSVTGAVVAEMPPGHPPIRSRFLMRNRLIAAGTAATVVVEAGYRSGSLNTAGHAAEIGRPLGAVPGQVTSPLSAGCHRLVRDYNATLVTCASEMAELVCPVGTEPQISTTGAATTGIYNGVSEFESNIWRVIAENRGVSFDDLVRRHGVEHTSIRAVLGRLEIEGVIRIGADGLWYSNRN